MNEVDKNKALVRQLTEEIWNRAELDNVAKYYSEDFISDYSPYAPPRKGLAGVRAMVEGAHKTCSDYHEEIIDLIGEGDRVMVRLMLNGTQTGNWGPIPPTGKKVSYQEVVVLTFRDGKVVHQRGLVDNLHALRQLGLAATPKPDAGDADERNT
jgi:predicted ester cyclase